MGRQSKYRIKETFGTNGEWYTPQVRRFFVWWNLHDLRGTATYLHLDQAETCITRHMTSYRKYHEYKSK